MSAHAPSSLDSNVLALRLRELAGEEREVQVDFLLHLEEFDRRRAFVDTGYPSLWAYCLEVLHLREGAAGRRIQAMKVLRRFPKLEEALRDGRLCLSTIALLGQVLTEENLDDLLARAAYRTKADVDHLVASVQARTAPRTGVRKLPEREPGMTNTPLPLPLPLARAQGRPEAVDESAQALAAASIVDRGAREIAAPGSACEKPKRTPETRAVTDTQWSLRVTIDRTCKEDLETLKSLLAHKVPDADLAAVLHEAIRCAIEKHGKRKGAVALARKANRSAPVANRSAATSAIPSEVRREVWTRDGGRCTGAAPSSPPMGDAATAGGSSSSTTSTRRRWEGRRRSRTSGSRAALIIFCARSRLTDASTWIASARARAGGYRRVQARSRRRAWRCRGGCNGSLSRR